MGWLLTFWGTRDANKSPKIVDELSICISLSMHYAACKSVSASRFNSPFLINSNLYGWAFTFYEFVLSLAAAASFYYQRCQSAKHISSLSHCKIRDLPAQKRCLQKTKEVWTDSDSIPSQLSDILTRPKRFLQSWLSRTVGSHTSQKHMLGRRNRLSAAALKSHDSDRSRDFDLGQSISNSD